MLGRVWWLDCYQLLLKSLNPSLSPAQLPLGERERSRGVEGQPRLGWCCFKKEDWKTTLEERKGLCAGRSPWGGF